MASYYERPFFVELVKSYKPVDDTKFFLIKDEKIWYRLLFSSAKVIPYRKIYEGITSGVENVKEENIISIYTQVILDEKNSYHYKTWVETVDNAIFRMIIE